MRAPSELFKTENPSTKRGAWGSAADGGTGVGRGVAGAGGGGALGPPGTNGALVGTGVAVAVGASCRAEPVLPEEEPLVEAAGAFELAAWGVAVEFATGASVVLVGVLVGVSCVNSGVGLGKLVNEGKGATVPGAVAVGAGVRTVVGVGRRGAIVGVGRGAGVSGIDVGVGCREGGPGVFGGFGSLGPFGSSGASTTSPAAAPKAAGAASA